MLEVVYIIQFFHDINNLPRDTVLLEEKQNGILHPFSEHYLSL